MAANNKCTDCGIDREPKYKNDCCCKVCRYKRNRAKRDADMLAKGKPAYGSGRNPLCSVCKKAKEPGRENESCCWTCKSERNKARRLKRRLESGLLPLGSGRSLYCYDCKALKENPSRGYCDTCRNSRERAARLEKTKDPNFYTEKRKQYKLKSENIPGFQFKKAAQAYTYRCIRDGLLVRKPCEVCGNIKVDAHHDDYTKPMDVRWLCRKHHLLHHRSQST